MTNEVTKSSIKSQVDALRQNIMSLVVALDNHPDFREALYEDEFATFTKVYEVLNKLSHICKE